MCRLSVVLSAALLLVTACAGESEAPRPPAQAVGERYVNLGDSYASGTGVLPLQQDSPFLCFRSTRNYATLVAERTGRVLTDVSCARAATEHLTAGQFEGAPPQFDALTEDTELVTMMIGGNDNGAFGQSIGLCGAAAAATPPDSCADDISALRDKIATATAPALVTAVRQIRQRAPRASVLLIGYPWILPARTGCYPDVPVAARDVPSVHDLQRHLNAAIGRAAAAAPGVRYVDMAGVSDGHDSCRSEGTRWGEPARNRAASVSAVGGLHPNAAGQRAIAEQVLAALN